MQAHRTIDKFRVNFTSDPTTFFDPSYSHSNMEWRILRVHYLISDSIDAKALFDEFESLRLLGDEQAPLYKIFRMGMHQQQLIRRLMR